MGILAWVLLGLIAGAIAKALYPGKQGGGIFATMALGILGSLLGGFLGNSLFGRETTGEISAPGIGFAVLGSVVVIFLFELLRKRPIAR